MRANFIIHILLLPAGVLLGHFLMVWRAGQVGLDPRRAEGFSFSLLAAALVVGHVVGLALLERPFQKPWFVLLIPLLGGNSLGCLLGAAIGGACYLWCHGLRARAFFDAGAWVFPFGWLILRTGCTLTHEPLAWMEVVHSGALAVVFWTGRQRSWPFAAILLVSFGAIRVAEHAQRTGEHRTDGIGAWLTVASGLAWLALEGRRRLAGNLSTRGGVGGAA